MARGRMLNRKISLNGDVAELVERAGFEAGLIYTWLIAHLDRDGRHHGDPDVVRSQVCPRLSGLTPDHVRTMLIAADQIGLLSWYEVDGEYYIEMPKFRENNKNMKYEREAPSEFPPNSGLTPDKVRTKSPLREGKGREVKGKEEKGRSLASAKLAGPPDNIQKIIDHFNKRLAEHHLATGKRKPKTREFSSSSKEVRWIKARMKEGLGADDLHRAIDGMFLTPHNLGQNETGDEWLRLDLAVKDTNVQRFIVNSERCSSPTLSKTTRRTVQAAQEWLNQGDQNERR